MDVSMLVITFAIGIIGMFWYSQTKLKNKLLCTFRRANKTKIEKLIPVRSRYIIFDKERYDVVPDRISLFWMNKGIHQFFPQWIPSLDYSWDSSYPHDPKNFRNTWDTPEAREASGQEDAFKAFAKGITSQVGKKTRFPEWLFPMVTVGAILVVGYLVYEQGQYLAYLEQLIKVGTP